jgi:hypothetical protein
MRGSVMYLAVAMAIFAVQNSLSLQLRADFPTQVHGT